MEEFNPRFKLRYASKLKEEYRLAAIMFTDIVGYTEIMGKDEKKALELLEMNMTIQKSIIEQYNGIVLKEMGDGMLISFNSSIDSVLCAKEIINRIQKESELPLRIGIHEGDVIYKGNDIYGEGVNIASRLQSEAAENRIYISQSVYDDIRNKPELNVEFIGERILKNVDQPIQIYSIINEDMSIDYSGVLDKKVSNSLTKSIIVLPFHNISAEEDQEYFADGLTDEIITDLSQINNFRVISRNSSMCFKGTKKNTKSIAKEVSVQYVLEGSVRKSGDDLRITVQLVDAKQDTSIWAEKYTGTIEEIFDIQEKVSRSVVEALRAKLDPEESDKLAERPLDNPQALDCYFKAKNEMGKMSEDGFLYALNELEKGLGIIGDNALLYSCISLIYLHYYTAGINRDKQTLEIAQEYAQKVLKLKTNSSDGYFLLGVIKRYQGDIHKAINYFKKALEEDSFYLEALVHLCRIYSLQLGLPLTAEPLVSRILEIDPINSNSHVCLGFIHWMENNLDLALSSFRKSVKLDPENYFAKFWMTYILIWQGQPKEALETIEQILDHGAKTKMEESIVSWCVFTKYILTNDKSNVLSSPDELTKSYFWNDPELLWPGIGNFSLINDKNEALSWLERAIEFGWLNYPLFSEQDPLISNLRNDPRFQLLMKKVKKKLKEFQD